MYCDNEIKMEELHSIYRIEYMTTSNWVMGNRRMIWVVEFEDITSDDFPKRSVYFGAPLVPEYRIFNRKSDLKVDIILNADGDLVFCNHLRSCDYYDVLHKLEVWNWKNLEGEYEIIDGSILDIAFFTKDSEGNDKICRYQSYENEIAENITEIFDRFFETMNISQIETVRQNKEMMERSLYLLPGNYEDEKEENRHNE